MRILGGPDMFVDTGTVINLTCIVSATPGPPRATLWQHNRTNISFRGPRPGVSLIVDKSEVTTVQLIIISARCGGKIEDNCERCVQVLGLRAVLLQPGQRTHGQHHSACPHRSLYLSLSLSPSLVGSEARKL